MTYLHSSFHLRVLSVPKFKCMSIILFEEHLSTSFALVAIFYTEGIFVPASSHPMASTRQTLDPFVSQRVLVGNVDSYCAIQHSRPFVSLKTCHFHLPGKLLWTDVLVAPGPTHVNLPLLTWRAFQQAKIEIGVEFGAGFMWGFMWVFLLELITPSDKWSTPIEPPGQLYHLSLTIKLPLLLERSAKRSNIYHR